MTKRSKADLQTQIDTNFADNTAGDITASDLRSVTTDIIDSVGFNISVGGDDLFMPFASGVTFTGGDFITTALQGNASSGIITITCDLNAGNGISINTGNGQITPDLLSAGGLVISSNKIAVNPDDFVGSGLANDGFPDTGKLRLDINNLPSDASAGNVADSVAIADASDSNHPKKITISQLGDLIADAGSGNAFKTISAGGDSGYTWTSQNDIVSEGDADTLFIIAGTGIRLDTDATNDAVRFSVSGSLPLATHPSISAASSSENSGNTFIQDITVDSYGHITAIDTNTVPSGNYAPASASGTMSQFRISNLGKNQNLFDGSGIDFIAGSNVSISMADSTSGVALTIASDHPSISAASSSDNTGNTFIQDITLDSNGHVTAIGTNTVPSGNYAPVSASGTMSKFHVGVNGNSEAVTDGSGLFFAAGDNMTISLEGNNGSGILTFTSSTTEATSGNAFKTISAVGDTGYAWTSTNDIVAEGDADTLSLVMGTGIRIDTNASGDAIRFSVSGSLPLDTHPSISAASSSSNAGNVFIQDIAVDAYGHITSIDTNTIPSGNYATTDSPVFTGTVTTPRLVVSSLAGDNSGLPHIDSNGIIYGSGIAAGPSGLRINGVAVTADAGELNILDGVTADANELNILDGVTATTAELNYVDGVTSAIQTQLDTKGSGTMSRFRIGAEQMERAVNINDGSGLFFAAGDNMTITLSDDSAGSGVLTFASSASGGSGSGTMSKFHVGVNGSSESVTDGSGLMFVAGDNMTISLEGNNGSGILTFDSSASGGSGSGTMSKFHIGSTTQVDPNQISIGDGSGLFFAAGNNMTVTTTNTDGSGVITFASAVSTNNPTFTGTITIGSAEISETELEILDGATLTTTELNYVDGVTSAIQTQLDSKGSGTMSRLKIGATDGLPQLQQLGDGSGIFFAAGDNVSVTLTNTDAGSGVVTIASSHPSISAASSSNNSGNTFIQDITVDGNGHITGIGTNTIPSGNYAPTADPTFTGTVTASRIVVSALAGNTGGVPHIDSDGIIYGSGISAGPSGLRIAGVAVTSSAAEINILDGVTADANELNLLDGVTATTAELNYVDGVTSAIQTQLDSKGSGTMSKFHIGSTTQVDPNQISIGDGSGLFFAAGDNMTITTTNTDGSGVVTFASTASGGSARSVAGDTDNGLITWVTSDNTFAAESNLTYDGTTLKVAGLQGNNPGVPFIESDGIIYGSGIATGASGLRIAGVAVTSTAAELNILDGVTADANELNLLDGVTATTTELNYVDGVTSAIQTQLDAKGSGTMSRLKIGASDGLPQLQQLGDGSGLFFAAGDNMTIALTNNDAGSGIITFSSAVPVNNPTFTGNITIGSAEISETELEILDGATLTTTELNYVDGVTSAIQTQLDAKGSGTMSRLKVGASDGLPQLQQLGDGSGLFFSAGSNMSVTLTNSDAGSGILTFASAHPSISAASDSTNTGNTFIQSLGFDSNGHVTSVGTNTVPSGNYAPTADPTFTGVVTTPRLVVTALAGNTGGVPHIDSDGIIYGSGISAGPSGLRINGTAITATPAELNLIDGGATVGTTAVADGDGIIHNDDGTMRVTTVQTFDTYFAQTTKTLTNKTLTSPTITSPTITGTTTLASGVTIGLQDNDTSDGYSLEVAGQIGASGVVVAPITASDGSTITFDLKRSSFHMVTLGGNRTLAVEDAKVGQKFMIRLQQDGAGSRTVTFFDGIRWAGGGTAPTLTTTANQADLFGFVATSGTTEFDGFIIGQNI